MAAEGIYTPSTHRSGESSLADTNLSAASQDGWRGSGVFAISPACRRRRRIADSRQTPHQPAQAHSSEWTEGTYSMAIGTARKRELESTLKSVINVLEDGQKGMAEIGEHLKDPTLRRYFLTESLRRANFRAELENVLHRQGIHDVARDWHCDRRAVSARGLD